MISWIVDWVVSKTHEIVTVAISIILSDVQYKYYITWRKSSCLWLRLT